MRKNIKPKPSEQELINLYVDQKMTDLAIGKMYNLSGSVIGSLRAKYKIVSNVPKYNDDFFSADEKNKIINMYSGGLSEEEICKSLCLSRRAVCSALKGTPKRTNAEAQFERQKKAFIPLTNLQEQLILGSLLGDGCLHIGKQRNKENIDVSFNEGHGDPQKEYIAYKAEILGVNIYTGIVKNGYKPGNGYNHITYKNSAELKRLAEFCLNNGRKTISKEWVDKLTPYSIAIWFMDDGSSSFIHTDKSRGVVAKFCTMSFNKDEHILLQNKLLELGIETLISPAPAGTKLQLVVRAKSINKLMDLIEPHVLPSLSYKIKRFPQEHTYQDAKSNRKSRRKN
jgi:LAGLIDADG DNA endonuclease family